MKNILIILTVLLGISQGINAQIQSNGDIVSSGTNSWLFHTPDDGRTSLYLAPGTTGNVWSWKDNFEFKKDGTLGLKKLYFIDGGSIYMEDLTWIRIDKDFFSPKIIRTDNQLQVGANGDMFLVDPITRNVGIGTVSPKTTLEVNGVTTSNGVVIWGRNAADGAIDIRIPVNEYNVIRGTNGSENIGDIHFFDTSWSGPANSAGSLNLHSKTAVTIGAWDNPIAYFRKSDKNVGIGTINPDERLTVKGKIHAEEIKVDLQIPADYVFQKYYTGNSTLKADYKMPSLEEIEKFTKENHHLPNIPSAKEIQEKGLYLGEMSNLLLQKIEELTLYTIEQKKLIESQQKLIENQEKRLQKLENQ